MGKFTPRACTFSYRAGAVAMRELELKFGVPETTRPALLRELRRLGARSTRMVARYFDTPDGLLGRHRISLRLRREGRRWVQTLKAAGANVLDRLEHNAVLAPAAGPEPALDLSRHDGTEAGARLREVLAGREHELLERHATDFVRRAVRLSWPGSAVELALDIGSIRAGERSLPLCELEIEHLEGRLDELFELAMLWRRHGSLWLDTRSKALRGALLAEGRPWSEPARARAVPLPPAPSGDEVVRRVVDVVLDQVLANASELAAGSDDAEHLHQLRIGLRRLRTALRELGALASGIDPGWEPRLAEVFAQLGAIRDDSTVAAAVQPLLEQAGAPIAAWPAGVPAAPAGEVVRGDAFQDTVLALLRWTLGPVPAPEPTPVTSVADCRAALARRLHRLHRQLRRDAGRFAELPTAAQHRVRKRLKRLRYLAEFVAALWPGKAVRRSIAALAPAQDALGHHNDVLVAGERFLAHAAADPTAYFAAGFLRGHAELTGRRARRALRKALAPRPFWEDGSAG